MRSVGEVGVCGSEGREGGGGEYGRGEGGSEERGDRLNMKRRVEAETWMGIMEEEKQGCFLGVLVFVNVIYVCAYVSIMKLPCYVKNTIHFRLTLKDSIPMHPSHRNPHCLEWEWQPCQHGPWMCSTLLV